MKLNDIPKLMPVPFGVNGPREELLETSPAGNRSASYADGFPPITMLLKQAGGLPPKGENMNQILFELANGQRWSNSGAGYKFNKAFSEAVGGYPKGAQLLSNDGTKVYVSTKDDNKTDFNTSPGADWVTLGNYIGLSDYAAKTDLDKKLDKTAVVQTTGTSTTSVISQDGATKAFQPVGYSYSKEQTDAKYQLKGNYADKTSTSTQVFQGDVNAPAVRATSGTAAFELNCDSSGGFLNYWNGSAYVGRVKYPGKPGTMGLSEEILGTGQTVKSVKGSKNPNTKYTNSAQKPIVVYIGGDFPSYGSVYIFVNGVATCGLSTDKYFGFNASAIIPPGGTYEVTTTGGFNLVLWAEMS